MIVILMELERQMMASMRDTLKRWVLYTGTWKCNDKYGLFIPPNVGPNAREGRQTPYLITHEQVGGRTDILSEPRELTALGASVRRQVGSTLPGST